MPTDSTPPGQLPFDGLGLKLCIGCGGTKPLSDYYTKTNGKPYGRCKPCTCKQIEQNRIARADPVLLAERNQRKQDKLTASEKVCRHCSRLLPSTQFSPMAGKPGRTYPRCRECLDALRRMYIALNPEKEMERRKQWMQEHYDERMENTRRWRRRNPERRKEYGKQWNDAHRQDNIDRAMRWYYANPDKAREQRRLRKARVKGVGGTFSEADWDRLKAQSNWTCLACGAREPAVVLQADHVVPIAMGGWNLISNIQVLCARCNNEKNAKFIDYRTDFWKV